MNSFLSCRNATDAVPLFIPQNLYLKPIARLNVSVQLPQPIEAGKSISNWEIMEKLRGIIRPDEFSLLKVSKSSLEVIRFEAEIEDKSKLHRLIALLDGRSFKLNSFVQNCKIRAAEAKDDFPTKHDWDTFFRDAKNMNEMKCGERPDTIHISNLPIRWFAVRQAHEEEELRPSQKVFHRIFEKFGQIRVIDIPICDPYRKKMKEHMSGMRTFTFDEETFFEGYVQFKDYMGFARAMEAFRGMKLVHKDPKKPSYPYEMVNIKVDFDKTKHLSDASIKRRQIVRDRLMEKERDAEEKEVDFKMKLELEELSKRQKELDLKEAKEIRRREREERRKARYLSKLNINESDELKKKILQEEEKLKKVEVELQCIRILSELFNRLKKKHEQTKAKRENIDKKATDELTKYRLLTEQKLEEQRTKLGSARSGQIILSSILGSDEDKNNKEKHKGTKNDNSSSSESESEKNKKRKKKKKKKKKKHKKKKDEKSKSRSKSPKKPSNSSKPVVEDQNWYGYPRYPNMYPLDPMFSGPSGPLNVPGPIRPYFPPGFHPFHRGRGGPNGAPGPSRGYPRRRGGFSPNFQRGFAPRRGQNFFHNHNLYGPQLQEEYYKYFLKFLKDQEGSSRSRSRTRSKSRSRSRSRSRQRSRFSKNRSSRSRSTSCRRSRSRDKRSRFSRNRSRSSGDRSSSSRSKSRSRRSRSTSRRRSRSKDKRSRFSEDRSRLSKDSKEKSPRTKSRSASRKRSRSRHSRSRSRRCSNSRKRSRSRRSRKSYSRSRSTSRSPRRSSRTKASASDTKRSSSSKRNNKSPRKSSRSPRRSKSRSPSYLSIDSSKFISPSRLRQMRSRSKSWSLPKSGSKKDRSWSKSPSPSGETTKT